jgi:hypothetical protein
MNRTTLTARVSTVVCTDAVTVCADRLAFGDLPEIGLATVSLVNHVGHVKQLGLPNVVEVHDIPRPGEATVQAGRFLQGPDQLAHPLSPYHLIGGNALDVLLPVPVVPGGRIPAFAGLAARGSPTPRLVLPGELVDSLSWSQPVQIIAEKIASALESALRLEGPASTSRQLQQRMVRIGSANDRIRTGITALTGRRADRCTTSAWWRAGGWPLWLSL